MLDRGGTCLQGLGGVWGQWVAHAAGQWCRRVGQRRRKGRGISISSVVGVGGGRQRAVCGGWGRKWTVPGGRSRRADGGGVRGGAERLMGKDAGAGGGDRSVRWSTRWATRWEIWGSCGGWGALTVLWLEDAGVVLCGQRPRQPHERLGQPDRETAVLGEVAAHRRHRGEVARHLSVACTMHVPSCGYRMMRGHRSNTMPW